MDNWVANAVKVIEASNHRSADTHLIKLELPHVSPVDIYLKDESTHPTGSLKHRLARSLFLYALCNGQIHQRTTIIEASSGSTAVSEAYFARMIGLPFIAVMPSSTAASKIKQIELMGGQCHFVENATQMTPEAARLAQKNNGYFMDQFTYAERATDWRGNNNIAQSIYQQMEREPHPVPAYLVMSAGTGGTSATLGRYIRYQGLNSKLLVVDPENSAFYPGYINQDPNYVTGISSRIEGIGRPQVEPSFQAGVIDEMLPVPDGASVATMLWMGELLGRKVGPSSGTNLWGALHLAERMIVQKRSGSIVTVICDSGERYLDTYHNEEWVAEHIGELSSYQRLLAKW